VFICGADAVFRYPNDVILRDKLFTSMTRTKGWLFLSGVGDSIDIFSKEYNELVKNKFNLVFKQPDKEETKNIENVSRSRDNAESIFANQIKKMRDLGMSDDELQKMWMELLKIKK
jgi:superfamily I DNA and RNA helicase